MTSRLRELRIKAGLTQQQLADAIEVEVQTIARIETGKRKPGFERIKQIADALGVAAGDLFDNGQAVYASGQDEPIRAVSDSAAIHKRLTKEQLEKEIFDLVQRNVERPATSFDDIKALHEICSRIASFGGD